MVDFLHYNLCLPCHMKEALVEQAKYQAMQLFSWFWFCHWEKMSQQKTSMIHSTVEYADFFAM